MDEQIFTLQMELEMLATFPVRIAGGNLVALVSDVSKTDSDDNLILNATAELARRTANFMNAVREELGIDLPKPKIVVESATRGTMLRASIVIFLAFLGFRGPIQRLRNQGKLASVEKAAEELGTRSFVPERSTGRRTE
jgi:hypothetical protein